MHRKFTHIMESMIATAKEELLETGEVRPLFVMLHDLYTRINVGLIPYEWDTHDEKSEKFRMLKFMVKEAKPDAYIFINDVWVSKFDRKEMSEAEAEEFASNHMPSDQPFYNRQDAITVALVHKSGDKNFRLFPYKKIGNGDIAFEDDETDWSAAEKIAGRLATMFED